MVLRYQICLYKEGLKDLSLTAMTPVLLHKEIWPKIGDNQRQPKVEEGKQNAALDACICLLKPGKGKKKPIRGGE